MDDEEIRVKIMDDDEREDLYGRPSLRSMRKSIISRDASINTICTFVDEYECSVITSAHIKQIGQELGIVDTCWPEIEIPEFESHIHYPENYYKQSEKEKLALCRAENFRQQFKHFFPNRKALVIAIENGCGLQKLVCNTVRPTSLPYLELKQWEGCAQFVADYVTYEILDRPTLPVCLTLFARLFA